jgi:hypothetical protein
MDELLQHVRNGWTNLDLPKRFPELRFDQGPHQVETVSGINGPVPRVLRDSIGQCRMLFLYDRFMPTGRSGAGRLQLTEAVAGRNLTVEVLEGDGCELIIQPGVMTTRTAILASQDEYSKTNEQENRTIEGRSEQVANRYIYKLQITN